MNVTSKETRPVPMLFSYICLVGENSRNLKITKQLGGKVWQRCIMLKLINYKADFGLKF